MITLDEFEQVQRLLGRPGRGRSKHHAFAYTGMIRCGECGFAVTAEEKANRFGSRYIYYHCTRRRRDYVCRQPAVSLPRLEEQLTGFLREIQPPESMHQWALRQLHQAATQKGKLREEKLHSLERAGGSCARELENLTTLRLRDLITDEEFVIQRKRLEQDQLRLAQNRDAIANADKWFEPATLIFSFSNRAIAHFTSGDNQTKRLILEIVGSNFMLTNRILSIEAKKPFRQWPRTAELSTLQAFVEDVRNFLLDPLSQHTVAEIRQLAQLTSDPAPIETA